MSQTFGQLADSGAPIVEVFAAIVELHEALREAPVKDRVWTYAWTSGDRQLQLVLNGQSAPHEGIPAFHVLVNVNGLPALLCSPFEGTRIGPERVETVVLEAINEAIERARSGETR